VTTTVLDASVLIAHLDGRDVFHEQAVELIRVASADRLAVSVVTLAEVLVGPARVGMLPRAQLAIESLRLMTCELGQDAPMLLAGLRVETGLKLPDCCVILAAVQAEAAAVLTFDDRLRAAAKAAGFAVELPT
jgi:predicted nucleic acid-binding protein